MFANVLHHDFDLNGIVGNSWSHLVNLRAFFVSPLRDVGSRNHEKMWR